MSESRIRGRSGRRRFQGLEVSVGWGFAKAWQAKSKALVRLSDVASKEAGIETSPGPPANGESGIPPGGLGLSKQMGFPHWSVAPKGPLSLLATYGF